MTLISVLGIAGITLSTVGVGKVIQAKRQTVGSREFLEHLSWYSTKPRWGKSNSHARVPSVMRPPQSPPFPLPLNCSHCFPKKKKVSQKFFLPQQAVSYARGQRVIPPAELGGRSRPPTLQTKFPLSLRRKPQGSLAFAEKEDALKIDPSPHSEEIYAESLSPLHLPPKRD